MWVTVGVIVVRVWGAGVIGATGLTIGLAATTAILVSQLIAIVRVNRAALTDPEAYSPAERYPFRSVAVLSVAYLCTFGAELAVVTMLPAFYATTWGLGPALAGLAASSAAFMNLVTRPAGGLLSDIFGDRRRTLAVLLAGVAVGYLAMATLGPAWPVPLAILLSLVCSGFGQASNGAVYAIVPLVTKRVSGQIAGIAGAYGNIGGVLFLTALTVVGPRWFFVLISATAVVALVATRWLVVPAPAPLAVEIDPGPAPAVDRAMANAGLPAGLAPIGAVTS
jgi:NNP family nitrate/nitrite transporter-like MFS transporter